MKGILRNAAAGAAIRMCDVSKRALRQRGSQRRASFTSQTQPIYNVIETTMAGQKPRRGTPTIMAMT